MLRNLLAIIIATLAGFTLAKFAEGAIGGTSGLLTGWFVGAFVAAVIALLIGRSWAPLGMLGAGTIFFSAVIALIGAPAPLWLWPAAALATALGGFLALRLLKAHKKLPQAATKETLFD